MPPRPGAPPTATPRSPNATCRCWGRGRGPRPLRRATASRRRGRQRHDGHGRVVRAPRAGPQGPGAKAVARRWRQTPSNASAPSVSRKRSTRPRGSSRRVERSGSRGATPSTPPATQRRGRPQLGAQLAGPGQSPAKSPGANGGGAPGALHLGHRGDGPARPQAQELGQDPVDARRPARDRGDEDRIARAGDAPRLPPGARPIAPVRQVVEGTREPHRAGATVGQVQGAGASPSAVSRALPGGALARRCATWRGTTSRCSTL